MDERRVRRGLLVALWLLEVLGCCRVGHQRSAHHPHTPTLLNSSASVKGFTQFLISLGVLCRALGGKEWT